MSVTTNDPAKPAFSLTLSFNLIQVVEVLPAPYFNLGAVQGAPAEATLVIRRPDGKPLMLKEVTTPQAMLKVSYEKVTEKNADPPNPNNPQAAKPGDWRVTVRVPDTSQVMNQSGMVKVLTDHPEKPEININVTVGIRPVVDAYPQMVQVQLQAGGSPGIARVDLRHNGRQPFKVTAVRVEGNVPGVSTRILNEAPSAVQPVEITVGSKDQKEGIYRGKLVLSTDQPAVPEKTVDLVVRVTTPPPAPVSPPPSAPAVGGK